METSIACSFETLQIFSKARFKYQAKKGETVTTDQFVKVLVEMFQKEIKK